MALDGGLELTPPTHGSPKDELVTGRVEPTLTQSPHVSYFSLAHANL